jgi:hypothetical protein
MENRSNCKVYPSAILFSLKQISSSPIARYKSHQSRKRKFPSQGASTTELVADKQMKLEEIHQKCYVRDNTSLRSTPSPDHWQEIAKEVNALNSVRHSLIWLLKKATLYETNLNHS